MSSPYCPYPSRNLKTYFHVRESPTALSEFSILMDKTVLSSIYSGQLKTVRDCRELISHRRRGQDKTFLSCPRLRCELGITQQTQRTQEVANDMAGWNLSRGMACAKLEHVLFLFRGVFLDIALLTLRAKGCKSGFRRCVQFH